MVVDTDTIIRYITRDDSTKADKFEKYIISQKHLIITDVTFAEVYWVLLSFYKFSKKNILTVLEPFITSEALDCNSEILIKTMSYLKDTNLSFIDCYTAAYSCLKSDSSVLSFDRGFDKLGDIKRVEP